MLPDDDPRQPLEKALLRYAGQHPERGGAAERMLQFIHSTPDCFCRSHREGHMTGSAWLLHPQGDRVLLTLHRKLGRWLQPGGHADGEPDTLAVALREAREESGIDTIEPLGEGIFDIDIHEIPARTTAGEPAHLHYDVRYLMQAQSADFRVSDESEALAWFRAEELDALRPDESVLRMRRLWLERGITPAGNPPPER